MPRNVGLCLVVNCQHDIRAKLRYRALCQLTSFQPFFFLGEALNAQIMPMHRHGPAIAGQHTTNALVHAL